MRGTPSDLDIETKKPATDISARANQTRFDDVILQVFCPDVSNLNLLVHHISRNHDGVNPCGKCNAMKKTRCGSHRAGFTNFSMMPLCRCFARRVNRSWYSGSKNIRRDFSPA